MTGIVKRYNDRHGYGFIEGDDGQTYFAHISEVKNAEELKCGQLVSYEPKSDLKGMAAINIEVRGE